ncbi:MAG TPA: UDP-N-acetylmuramoyl-L-alanyl-D-glutamate--2,6-diaminopimelate ligase [Sedimenticola sp.]|nr:UDP-N-acetylmuramoyl-L-alanyl-D-glutamate--2,6-diaminopimelate ligase [Sedimenticola sp.]
MMAARRIKGPWRLSALLAGLAEVPPGGDCPVSGLTLDSRTVAPGDLFLACAGAAHHGLDFAGQALDRKAAAILCEPGGDWRQERIDELAAEIPVPLVSVPDLSGSISALAARFYGDPSQALAVIGVTGTNGKTSCAQFLAEALGGSVPCGVIGTLGSGFPGALTAGRHTTPEPVELQALLADLRERGAAAVALEVSSHALEQGRAAAVRFDTAVLTNLSRDHLDFHGGMDAYAAAKRRLFLHPGLRCAVLNLDDPFGREILAALPDKMKVVGYGLSRPGRPAPARVNAWLWAPEITSTQEGLSVRVETSWGEGGFSSPLLGRFNASNLLAVLGVLLERGIPLPDALERLSRLHTPPGRMERFGGGGQPLVVVDYAHTPDALEQAITALRPHTRGRLLCLFGCGGDRDRGKRPLMGAIAERLCDRVVLTDDNPRSEDGGRIIGDILAGMQRPASARVVRNRAEAIRQIIAGARPGDLVLVSGKGHETVQQCGDLCLHFSDREQVQKILSGEGGR